MHYTSMVLGNMNFYLNHRIQENWKLLHKYFPFSSCQVNIYSSNNIVTIFTKFTKVGIPAEFKSFQRQIPITLMEATFDYPYFKDETNGFEIISLPYEHDGKRFFCGEKPLWSIKRRSNMKSFQEIINMWDLDFIQVISQLEVIWAEVQYKIMIKYKFVISSNDSKTSWHQS